MATSKKTTAKPAAAAKQSNPKTTAAARVKAARQRVQAVPVAGHTANKLGGFVTFLREQAVVGLAIGIVIGTEVQSIAKALIADFINPLIALLMPGGGDLATKAFYIHRTGRPPQRFMWGDFVSGVIAFIMILAVIYFVIKGLKLDKLDKKKDAAK